MGRGPKVGQGPKVGRGAGVGPSAPNGGSVGAAVGAGARGMRGGDVTPPTMNPVSGWFGPGGAVLRGACVGNFGEGVVSYRMAGRPVAPTASRLELGEALGTTAAICQGRTPSMDRITSTAMALIVASLKADLIVMGLPGLWRGRSDRASSGRVTCDMGPREVSALGAGLAWEETT